MTSQVVIQMETEREDLIARAEKLFHLMQTETFKNLPYKNRDIIKRQYQAMRNLAYVLQERIQIEKVY